MIGPFMRSKLFVPGTHPELFEKALVSRADAISIDLEDSVPEDRKGEARALVGTFLRSAQKQKSTKVVIVRINATGTPHFEADLLAAATPGVTLLNLPKPRSAADVRDVATELARTETANRVDGAIGLLINIESAAALQRAAEMGAADSRVVALQLGLGDMFEPFGIDRYDIANVHAAMFALRIAAAQAGVAAYDGAFPGITDEAGYRAEAQMARRLGFAGKTCIHPDQVEWANEVFALSPDEVVAAQRVVDAARAAAAEGRAAFVVDGRMIDPPFLARALAVVSSAGG